MEINRLLQNLELKRGIVISFYHIRAHILKDELHVMGNLAADEIAQLTRSGIMENPVVRPDNSEESKLIFRCENCV
jgi:hypothetical protein